MELKAKFKIGDKVKLKSRLWFEKNTDISFLVVKYKNRRKSYELILRDHINILGYTNKLVVKGICRERRKHVAYVLSVNGVTKPFLVCETFLEKNNV